MVCNSFHLFNFFRIFTYLNIKSEGYKKTDHFNTKQSTSNRLGTKFRYLFLISIKKLIVCLKEKPFLIDYKFQIIFNGCLKPLYYSDYQILFRLKLIF